ncbi:MAG: DUF2946 family protein [Pseudomonadota bacterium]
MIGPSSTLTAVWLSFLVALINVAAGAAHLPVDASGRMVICTGEGPVVIVTGASDGHAGTFELCAHCAKGILAAQSSASAALPETDWATRTRAVRPTLASPVLQRFRACPHARAPPSEAYPAQPQFNHFI